MNMKYAVLVVWDCDADRVIWRGDYVFCKFIQSDCCKIGDEKYVSGKYSIDEIQQLSKNRWIVKKVYGEIWRFFQTWMKKNVCKFGISYQSNFQLTFSREFSDCCAPVFNVLKEIFIINFLFWDLSPRWHRC